MSSRLKAGVTPWMRIIQQNNIPSRRHPEDKWAPPRREVGLFVGYDVLFAEFIDQGIVIALGDFIDTGAVEQVGCCLLDEG